MLPPYNDFFKVGVSTSGNHDNNIYNQNWSEQYHGLKVVAKAGTGRGNVVQAGRQVSDVIDNTDGNGNGNGNAAAARGGRAVPRNNGDFDGSISADDTTNNYWLRVPTTVELAANLKGRLMLATGDMDNNVHPANTIRLAEALIKANKRFDFMIYPGKQHGYGDMQQYNNRLTFEYFAEHLLGDYYRTNAIIK
jgi:dipeptidyl-peptidase 4